MVMDTHHSREGAAVVVTRQHGTVCLSGELDALSRTSVESDLVAQLRPSATLTIDCRHLTFCDSSGLATLMAVRERAALDSATVRLRNLKPNVVRLLRITSLLEAFGVEDSDADI